MKISDRQCRDVILTYLHLSEVTTLDARITFLELYQAVMTHMSLDAFYRALCHLIAHNEVTIWDSPRGPEATITVKLPDDCRVRIEGELSTFLSSSLDLGHQHQDWVKLGHHDGD